ILVLLIISSFVGCRNHNESDNLQPLQVGTSGEILSLTAEQLKTLPIDTVSPAKKKVTNVLMLSGKVDVDPDYRLSLSSALGGHIKSVHALPGKPVRKGEIIVELEDNQIIEIQREYLTSKARLQSAEADYTRQKDLNANKSASDKTLQLAEAEYKSLLAASTALEEKLRLIHINP